MWRFKDISLKHKLMLIIMSTSSAALSLVCASFVLNDLHTYRGAMIRNLTVQASIISTNSTAAFSFEDPTTGKEVLSALRANPEVVGACLFDDRGHLFARYLRDPDQPDFNVPLRRRNDPYFFENALHLYQVVKQDDNILGTLYIQCDLSQVRARLVRYASIASGVFLGAVGFALLLSARMHRLVSDPILFLAKAANQVARHKNYGVRVVKFGDDELGHLIDSFNEMLAQIHARDVALQQAHNELEQRVAERTNELSRSNALLKQEIEHRASLESQLRQSQKMEAIGQLAGGVAHDFNNILTIIQGHVSLLAAQRGMNPEARESLQELETAANRAANLTRQLLAFSRRQVLQRRPLDLNEVIGNLAKMLLRLIGEDIALQCGQSPHLPPVLADAGMIEQVILNLAVNARDAMPQGGRLCISASREVLDPASLSGHAEGKTGTFVCLSVTDTGCGMDEATLNRIFEPFFTTKPVGKGTGLGLATVYGIVKQHEGWIEVQSKVNHGTAFKIYLPACSAPSGAPPAISSAAAARGGNETILVVEDEADLRNLVARVLRQLGYTVCEAADGLAALALWQERRERIDLLLTDVVMPNGWSGLQLAQRLLREKPALKIIYTSGYSIDLLSKDIDLTPGFNLLVKPFGSLVLAHRVRDCLDGKTPSPPPQLPS